MCWSIWCLRNLPKHINTLKSCKRKQINCVSIFFSVAGGCVCVLRLRVLAVVMSEAVCWGCEPLVSAVAVCCGCVVWLCAIAVCCGCELWLCAVFYGCKQWTVGMSCGWLLCSVCCGCMLGLCAVAVCPPPPLESPRSNSIFEIQAAFCEQEPKVQLDTATASVTSSTWLGRTAAMLVNVAVAPACKRLLWSQK